MMLMRNVAVSAFLLVSTVTASTDRCDVITPSMKLKFYNGALGRKNGTLDEGGELRFKQVGEQYGKKLDLVITVHPGTHYRTNNDDGNKAIEQFGQLNIYKKLKGKPNFNSKGTFDFCFRDSGNNGLVNIDSFHFAFYDIGQRSPNKRGSNIQRESIAIDASQMENFYLYNTSEEKSTVLARCENSKRVPTSSAPCVDERTEFVSNGLGKGYTKPKKVTNLTDKQKSRSVVFTFRNRSCFTAELRITCGGHSKCLTNKQANFLFAGAARGLIEDTSTCVATPPEPSDSPSSNPSVSPTQWLTNTPSSELSVSPTQGPTNTPSRELSVSPTQGPTNTPSRELSVSPTQEPTHSDEIADEDISPPQEISLSNPCVRLLKTDGVTKFPLTNPNTPPPVAILSQDKKTVSVALTNAWGSEVDAIYYEYRPSMFESKCYEKQQIQINEIFAEKIEIQCNALDPIALLTICVVDDDKLDKGDGATVPQCCQSSNPEGSPTVCYHLEITCVTGCSAVGTSRRSLRSH